MDPYLHLLHPGNCHLSCRPCDPYSLDYFADLRRSSQKDVLPGPFTRGLLIDERGEPTNTEHAYYRAAQCVKQWCVPGYEVDPPFAGWETELH